MTYETNIVALAENEFLDNTRKLMEKRDTGLVFINGLLIVCAKANTRRDRDAGWRPD
jgi:hypothetical protein